MIKEVTRTPLVPVSWGELIDKITILQLKRERIRSSAAVANVERELAFLNGILAEQPEFGSDIARLTQDLHSVNSTLWGLEDEIREKERHGEFDESFIALARMIYKTNDSRAKIKRDINIALDSGLVEEKSYASRTERP